MRITHPTNEIFLWDDDLSGAYRIPKYQPDVAGAFSYALPNYFFLPTGGTFGFNTSSQEYEPFARARAFIEEHLSRDQTLVLKHQDILSLVEFEVESNPSIAQYTRCN